MSNTSIVKLNIGGTHFQTSRTTLTRYDGFFKTLMETEYPVAKDDPIFVDRSPKHFEKILNYMRDGSIVLPNFAEDVKEIQNEAQYYLLTGLVKMCAAGGPMEIRFVNNWQEEISAILNSPKKAVMIVRTKPNCHVCPELISRIVLQYQEILDVFFTVTPHPYLILYDTYAMLYDKTKNNNFVVEISGFEELFKSRCAHLL